MVSYLLDGLLAILAIGAAAIAWQIRRELRGLHALTTQHRRSLEQVRLALTSAETTVRSINIEGIHIMNELDERIDVGHQMAQKLDRLIEETRALYDYQASLSHSAPPQASWRVVEGGQSAARQAEYVAPAPVAAPVAPPVEQPQVKVAAPHVQTVSRHEPQSRPPTLGEYLSRLR